MDFKMLDSIWVNLCIFVNNYAKTIGKPPIGTILAELNLQLHKYNVHGLTSFVIIQQYEMKFVERFCDKRKL